MKTRSIILAISILGFLSGCTVGPNYQSPSTRLPAQFVAGQGSSIASPETELWWRDLNDPILNGLIDRALAQNLDIRSSVSRLEQAQAQLRGTGINEQISGDLTSSLTRSGGDNLKTTQTETTTLTGSFVIDLFGGVKRGREQALANLEATGFNIGDAKAAVTLAVVSNYVSARFSQEAAQLTRNTISSRRQTLSLVRSKRELGSSSKLDVAQAEADLFAARADLEGYISDFEGAVFALATLLDTAPFPVLKNLQKGAQQLSAPNVGNLGVPADLLRNLPSIRSAERSYAAAVAEVGVQEAKLYPSVQLSGTISLSGLTTNTWSYGPSLTLPVFNQGALRANRDAKVAAMREAKQNWQIAVNAAIEDIETNAHALRRSKRQISLLRDAAFSSTRSLELNRANFEAGQSSLFELLDADRTTLTRRLSLASETRAAMLEWAQLQVALGRGWQINSEELWRQKSSDINS